MLILVLASFFAALITSLLLTPVIRKFAPALGLVDHPGHRKVHVTPTPMGGGIAVFAGVAIPAFVVWMFPATFSRAIPFIQTVAGSLLEDSESARQMYGIAFGGITLFFVGLADDRWGLSWKLRLGLQVVVAFAVTQAGVRATVFVAQPWIGIGITMLWILILTNALNFLDNMDGLSAGIGVIASLMSAAILMLMVSEPHWAVAFVLLLLGGSLSGFLFWNRPPASIFMGDSGSNLIGFLLATLTVSGTFYERTGSRHVILAPLCVLAIPLYDFLTVILIRLKAGRSPFHGDKSHFSHRLVELGLRPARAVLTIHLATLMTGLGGLLLYKVQDWTGAFLIIALICCVLSLVSILETVGRRTVSARSMNSLRGEQSKPADTGEVDSSRVDEPASVRT